MILSVGNVFTKFVITAEDKSKCPKISQLIKDKLKIRADGYQYAKAYKDGYWDGFKSLISTGSHFLTGYLKSVVGLIKSEGLDVDIMDLRKNRPILKTDFVTAVGNSENWELRDYQERVIKVTLTNHLETMLYPRGLWNLAVNSGKMIMLTGLVNNIHNPKTLLIIDREVNFKQNVKWFSDIYPNQVTTVTSNGADFSGSFVIAMAKTLSNLAARDEQAKKELKTFQIVCCDEAHRAGSDTYHALLSEVDAFVRIMMSGTTLDIQSSEKKLQIMGMSGTALETISNEEMVGVGKSLKPTVNIHLNTDGQQFGFYDFDQAYKEFVCFSKCRVEKMAEIIGTRLNALDKPMSWLISVVNIEHGEFVKKNLVELFKGSDKIIEFVHAAHPDRDIIIEDFAAGNINVLITTSILQESANIPIINGLIYAQGGRSKVAMKQYYGRAAREDGYSDGVEIHDFWDNCTVLHKASRARIKTWKAEGFDTKVLYPHGIQYTPKK